MGIATAKKPLSTGEKVLVGALGGMSAVCVKFLGQDYTTLVEQGANLSADQLFAFKIGYGVLTPILIFLGAVLAWVSEESNRLKLLAIGIAAPALITTWSGGTKPADAAPQISMNIISSAYANETPQTAAPPSGERGELPERGFFGDLLKAIPNPFPDPNERSDKGMMESALEGVAMFFGYGKTIKQYYVVVGSFKSPELAKQHASNVNLRDPALNAQVGRKTANNYYPVVIGAPQLLSEANKAKDFINKRRIVTDAYLAPADEIKPDLGFASSN